MTGLSVEAAAALFVLAVVVLIIGAATKSALVWVGLVGTVVTGGLLLFAFLRLVSTTAAAVIL